MALVVEDGSVVVGAESYVTLAQADAYWAKRNNATWEAATDEAKEAGLREAVQYLDGAYKWIGSICDSAQPLQWPRSALWDNSGRNLGMTVIPQQLKDAQCEMANESLSGRIVASQDRGGMLASAIVGPLAVTYQSNAPSGRTYLFIDLLLRDISDGRSFGGITAEAVRG